MQRRRTPGGRPLHCCCICLRLAPYSDGWSMYCSIKELDDGVPVPKFCSDSCRKAGGPRAKNVTAEMKRTAHDKEWREPEPHYETPGARSKYDEATRRQRRALEPGHDPDWGPAA